MPLPKTSEFFQKSIQSKSGLELALQLDSSILNAQDEHGRTMLHYAASSRNCSIRRVLTVLFTYPNLDFTVKDNQNNTPLHVAALCCEDRTTYNDVLPMLLAEAGRRGFNFLPSDRTGNLFYISRREFLLQR